MLENLKSRHYKEINLFINQKYNNLMLLIIQFKLLISLYKANIINKGDHIQLKHYHLNQHRHSKNHKKRNQNKNVKENQKKEILN